MKSLALSLFASAAAQSSGTCQPPDPNNPCVHSCPGHTFDLTPFKSVMPSAGYYHATDDQQHDYYFMACGQLSVVQCQGSTVTTGITGIQTWGGQPPTFPAESCAALGSFSSQSCHATNKSLTCDYTSGDGGRSLSMVYKCGKIMVAPVASQPDPQDSHYDITFTGPAACNPAGPPVPSPFPAAASYTAHLRTTNRSQLCASCTFDGRHAYDSDPAKKFGHVAWLYGPNDKPKAKYVNFLDVFLGAEKAMFLVQDGGGGEAGCTKISPYPAPIFNSSWAKGAKYEGTGWFHERLTHRWSNVYPFFIQGEVYPSVYHEDVFTRMPAGFVNEVEEFWYDAADFVVDTPSANLFLAVKSLNCSESGAA